MQSEARIGKAGFRSIYFPTALRIAIPLLSSVGSNIRTYVVFFLETLVRCKGVTFKKLAIDNKSPKKKEHLPRAGGSRFISGSPMLVGVREVFISQQLRPTTPPC